MELSQTAQHWVNVVLMWVGFGALAGTLAHLVLPDRYTAGPVSTLLFGILGSALGLLGLSLALGDRQSNPISPLGFFAATACALVLLVLYRVLRACIPKKMKETEDTGGGPLHPG
jgi:uncharacterized membrane protein YeaQ/YmgE (transglycosylase-associated protein family)